MSKSVYFPQYGGVNTEQNLVQDLVDEQIHLFGMDLFYIPKTMLIDRSLNDVILNEFREAHLIEMMLINVEGFGGSGAVAMSKFGLKLSDEITLAVSKRKWSLKPDLMSSTSVPGRPNEGDLVYVPMTKNIYEIKFVEREVPFYQLGKNYIFALTCELLENADNLFDTGNTDIDDYKKENYVFPVYLKTGGVGNYAIGEEVRQTYTSNGSSVVVTATVAAWNAPTRKLDLTYINGVLQQNVELEGMDSGSTWEVESFSTIDFDINDFDNAQNKYYEDTADEILDFNEGNPFGEFGDMGVF
jgi:hypothetical protein